MTFAAEHAFRSAAYKQPRLRLVRGMWYCGLMLQPPWYWACGETPEQAYELWVRCQ